MEQTTIDLNETVYSLCTKHPELIDLLRELGFADITKPGMLQSAGRFMTPAKGAALKHIAISEILSTTAAGAINLPTGFFSLMELNRMLDTLPPDITFVVMDDAVRDEAGEYLGVLEVTQDIAPIQAITGEKRLVSQA